MFKKYLIQLYFALRHLKQHARKYVLKILYPDTVNYCESQKYLLEPVRSLKKLGWGKFLRGELLTDSALVEPLIKRANELLESQTELQESAKKVTSTSKNFKISINELFNKSDLLNVITDTNLIQVVRGYLNTKFLLRQVEVWWDCPVPGDERDSQTFHVDGEDPHMLKVFVYLSDVKESDGPFVFVEKSHRMFNQFYLICKNGVAGIEQSMMPKENVRYCIGNAGDIFMADTNGFHKGLKASSDSKGRILLMLMFNSKKPISNTPIHSLFPTMDLQELTSLKLD